MELYPGISIIMPAYNCDRYISDAISSVIRQTYSNWELIIIDDESKDNTNKIANNFHDNRIQVIRNERNQGVAYNRNYGAKLSKYKWLAFLDSDDMWEESKLEYQINQMQAIPEGKLFYTGSAFVTADSKRLDYILHVPERICREEILKQNLISCSSVVVDKELFIQHPMPEDRGIHEDLASWLDILKYEKFAFGIDKPLLIYRLQPDSKSGNKFEAAKMQWRTYKAAGESFRSSTFNLITYALRGLSKYNDINRQKVVKKK